MPTAEEWKPVPDSHLEVSSLGRVRSNAWGKTSILKPYPNTTGYLLVNWRSNGKRFSRLVHRLVLEAFRGPCPADYESRHRDGSQVNNILDNLIWGTKGDNEDDKVLHGTSRRKLTHQDAADIRAAHDRGDPCRVLAARYAVSSPAIVAIINFRTYRHPGLPPPTPIHKRTSRLQHAEVSEAG
jgi:HNH endonuclease/NUMOD4 motif